MLEATSQTSPMRLFFSCPHGNTLVDMPCVGFLPFLVSFLCFSPDALRNRLSNELLLFFFFFTTSCQVTHDFYLSCN